MGRKKTTKKASAARRKKEKETKSIGLDFIGGILIAIGVILLVIYIFFFSKAFKSDKDKLND